ncbi:hypothetical protein [Paenibacillus taiwanensis]|nr:hypothetical protein [Paenibacillus taiwanensis]
MKDTTIGSGKSNFYAMLDIAAYHPISYAMHARNKRYCWIKEE